MLKEKITHIILDSRFVGKAAIDILNMKNYGDIKYVEECERRKTFDLWEYEELSKDMKPYYNDLSPNSSYYGIMYQIKRYAGIEEFCYYNVEHGLYLGEYVEIESFGKAMKGTITFSEKRKEYLEKRISKRIIPVGPYIHYAEEYYAEEKHKEVKKKLGRVLLAFPPHSTKTTRASYDTEKFIKKLKALKAEYDTVMVCMFFKDILSGAYKVYKDAGFIIVTSGNMYDYYFLSRQKEIIKLADFTVSASVGTHIGYCLYMGKQHQILNLSDDGSLAGNLKENIDSHMDGKRPVNESFSSFKSDQELLLNAFIDTEKSDEMKQRRLVSDIWGFDCIKNKSELRSLLL